MPLANQLVTDRLVVLDHTVMDQCELAALIEMGMRISVSDASVCGPAGMSQADRTAGHILLNQLRQIINPAGPFPNLHFSIG